MLPHPQHVVKLSELNFCLLERNSGFMKPASMGGPLASMVFLPDSAFDKDYGDFLLSVCIKMLAQALTALPALCFSVLPRLRSADSSVSDKQASFATRICEAEASGRHFDEPCLDSELCNTTDDSFTSEELSEVNCKSYGEAMQGPDVSKRMQQKDIIAWLALAKNKDDDDEDEDEEDEDDDEDDDDDAADEEGAGGEGEGEEEVEGHVGGGGGEDDDDDDDDDDDENGKGDDEEDEEDAVEGEDDEDEDGAEDDEDEDEEDDDDEETPEPPQKKRK
ncbi:hypothetical protein GOP47_0021664 [Adiantum capillus-veneris]|uniref:Uncharacterized protein n=1 Tax=Adiantum capillus-veneris TaxID=13818 RepID=A0A9D4U8T1_ADICA|nr:hypothetical protein GOP47_0021664 [Adiantum capillus-veneris]